MFLLQEIIHYATFLTMIQLDLFMTREEVERNQLLTRMAKTEAAVERMRKGQFGRIGELKAKISSLEARLGILEMHLCKNLSQSDILGM
jgi:hypothetical protein